MCVRVISWTCKKMWQERVASGLCTCYTCNIDNNNDNDCFIDSYSNSEVDHVRSYV